MLGTENKEYEANEIIGDKCQGIYCKDRIKNVIIGELKVQKMVKLLRGLRKI